MLVNLYKSKTPLAVFSLPLLIGVLGLPALFHPVQNPNSLFSWQFYLAEWVSQTVLVHYLLGVFLVYLGALEMNRLVNTYGFYSKNTYLPGVILALVLFSFDQQQFSMLLIAYVFLLYGLGFLFQINRQDPSEKSIFASGFFFGCATVFEPLLAPIVLLPWFALLVFRSFYWREWFVLIFGAGIPWLYHVGLFFAITGKSSLTLGSIVLVDAEVVAPAKTWVLIGFFALLTIFSVWKYAVISTGQLLVFKKRSRLLYHFIWLTLISLGVGWLFFRQPVLAVTIPLSVIIAVQMLNARTSFYANLIITLWIALVCWRLFF